MKLRTARNVHIADQALAALANAGGPLTTAEVAQAIGQPAHQQDTWRMLTWLERQGQVERLVFPDFKSRLWRCTPVQAGTPAEDARSDG